MRSDSRFNFDVIVTKKSRRHMCVAALKFVMAGLLLQCLGNVTGAYAAGASLNSHNAAVFDCSYLLQVRVPYCACFVVGVADVVSEAGTFSTDITFS
jgi:hypothetical protein